MNATSAIVAWLITAMLAWSPPGRSHILEAKESEEQGKARYEQISEALVHVSYDPQVKPIFTGPHARARTALLNLGLAYFESGFRRDVDLGLGKFGRGDYGKSHCMMQINMGRDLDSTSFLYNLIGHEWSANDLVQDRKKCFLTGQLLVIKSFNKCRSNPLEHRLAGYTSGDCDKGLEESQSRIRFVQKWYASHKPPFEDAVVLVEISSRLD